ncbi:peptide/nickel transport system permease protein [Streptomyces achromogenes]|uniref:Peptide/nickel transport system permease protein n=2 Tax=Streptomyces achromogenes TaxID=67255 RepID=A0ABU0PS43_STRAH|nr:peptide/nickel transport system permease protein [Streptomyces achromogenes]
MTPPAGEPARNKDTAGLEPPVGDTSHERATAMVAAAPPRARIGVILLHSLPALLLVCLALAGPWLAPHSVTDPVTAPFAEPGAGAPLGGDQLGRDVWSRLLAGGGQLVLSALLIAVVVTGAAAVLGAVAALRPKVGKVVERVADVLILLPAVLGIMLVALSWPEGGRFAVVLAAVVLGVPYAVRLAANAAAPVADAGYVESAAAGGERLWVLVVREILPNLRATLLALFGLRFVEAVYVVSTAGFLQVGPQPPAADWALMIRENSPGLLLNPWAVVAPSAVIGLLALSVNLAAGALAPQTGRKAVTVR